MIENKRTGAVGALLAEYEKAIKELQNVISKISDSDLVAIVDNKTTNADCRSIQTILAHVVGAGYSYCIYIRDHLNIKNNKLREKINRKSAAEYIKDLDNVLFFTSETFANIQDDELLEYDETKKINTRWGQSYDIEQLFEHAIVHILRHRLQIEKFKKLLRSDKDI